jgi:hypothetical protein
VSRLAIAFLALALAIVVFLLGAAPNAHPSEYFMGIMVGLSMGLAFSYFHEKVKN